jgi:hypothetical protein
MRGKLTQSFILTFLKLITEVTMANYYHISYKITTSVV